MSLRISNIFIIIILLFSCNEKDSANFSGGASGINGSTSAFTIVKDYLYVLDGQDLQVWSLSSPAQPTLVTVLQTVSSAPETLFGADSLLLVGTRNGILFYSLSNPAQPTWLSTYAHIVSCDPVVAQGNYAYATLRTGSPCQRGVNLFEVIDFSNIYFPTSVKTLNMNSPKGLAVSGNYAYICENQGVQVVDVSNPAISMDKLNLFGTFLANDIIFINNKLIITANDGIYQYDISNNSSPIMLSRLLYSL